MAPVIVSPNESVEIYYKDTEISHRFDPSINQPTHHTNQSQLSNTSRMIMRAFSILALAVFAASAHGAADILDGPEFAGHFAWQDEAISSSIPSATTPITAVSLPATTTASNGLVERQLIIPPLFLTALTVVGRIWTGFTYLVGAFGLANSSYGVYKDCAKQYDTRECILASIALVIEAFGVNWYSRHGLKRVRSDGLESHALFEDPDEPLRTIEYHVPVEKRSLKHSSAETENNGTWARHATFYWDGEESHYLMYRRASAEDLGIENDGSIHHYRVQDSDEAKRQRDQVKNGHPVLGKRLQKRSYGVVTDYLWKNGNYDAWKQYHDGADFKDMSRKVTGYLENNGQGVSCLTPIVNFGTHGGSSNTKVDNGIIAYGWNDQPYGFNGRAGAWVDACKGSNFNQ